VRTALQALAAALGGTQSLHTNALDEALALPTEAAATLALRTQQIIAHETGIVDVVDPLGGSYFLEKLTGEIEDEAMAYIDRIDRMGGMVPAIERGYPQKEIAESAYQFQRSVESKEQVIVGVNKFVSTVREGIGTLYIDESAGDRQLARLDDTRRRRDRSRVNTAIDRLQNGAKSESNLMPLLIDAVKAHATVGEMCDGLRKVWGEYVEDPII
jgi:methylmalonyl-CoA mutase N-terminal domain/subunit